MKKYLRGFGFSNFGMDVRAHLPERRESNLVSFLCIYECVHVLQKTLLVEGHLVPEWLWVQQFGRAEEEIFHMANHEFKSGDFKWKKTFIMELLIKPA